jgi:CRISPR system Cascade subunit CasB
MDDEQPFITYLEGLREDRGALAALRRGLGQPPGTVVSMYRYVVPWLDDDTPAWRAAAYYTVAALFASHPAPGGRDNMGAHFAQVRVRERSDTAIERRFSALLTAHPDDLDTYLRQAVSYLRLKEVPVNWHQLLSDVVAWRHPDRYVQKRWARAFWGRQNTQAQQPQET